MLTRRVEGGSVESLASSLVDRRELEARRSKLRRELFARQDEVEVQCADLIAQLETQSQQQAQEATLFIVEWELA